MGEVEKAINWIQEKRDFSKNTDDGRTNTLCLQALRQMQGWIPVSERLPEEYQHENGEPMEFNVMILGSKIPTTLCFNGDEWFEWSDWDKSYDITHWMPLPEPPKEVE